MLRIPLYFTRLGRSRIAPSIPRLLFCTNPKPQKPIQPKRPATGMSRQQLQKAHDQITRQMMTNEDAHSYEKEGFGNIHFLAGGMLIIVAGLVFTYFQAKATEKSKNVKENLEGGIKNPTRPDYGLGGGWELVDTKGRTLTHQNFRGGYYVIYFGFAKCPDVCPNFLSRMSKAMKILRNSAEAQLFRLNVLFVELDPDRDSPDDIERFLGLFDKNIIGVSGLKNSDPRLISCMKNFKIYANKIYRKKEDEGTKNYMIDHTALGFLMDHNNQLVMIIGPNLSGEQIAKAIIDDSIQTNNLEVKAIKVV